MEQQPPLSEKVEERTPGHKTGGHICTSCGGRDDGRNLVVCIDGTSNRFGINNTNIVELYRHLDKNDSQLTYYNSGIGTLAKPGFKSLNYYWKAFGHSMDLAFAWNFEKILLGAYRWLAENYKIGDRIYLYGFSRGAYQVRALSAMIDKVGLICRGNEEQIPFAFEVYSSLKDSKTPRQSVLVDLLRRASQILPNMKSKTDPVDLANLFKETFSRGSVKVHFVGAWDTVSSIGILGNKILPHTSNGMKHVCLFRHALALDERRVKFLPEYACGGLMESSSIEQPDVAASPMTRQSSPLQRTPLQGGQTSPAVCSESPTSAAGPLFLQGHSQPTSPTVPTNPILPRPKDAEAFSPPRANVMLSYKSPPSLTLQTDNVPQLQDSPMLFSASLSGQQGNDGKQLDRLEVPQVKEVWFRGTHSDIGGGNVENTKLNRGVPSLRWLSYESTQAGLLLDTYDHLVLGEEWTNPSVRPSSQGMWRLLEVIPFKRLSYRDEKATTWWPHLSRGRQVVSGQKIHRTVLDEAPDSIQRNGHPRAFLPDRKMDWDSYKASGSQNIEKDLFNVCREFLSRLRDEQEKNPSKRMVLEEFNESILFNAEKTRAMQELWEFNADYRVILSRAFSSLLYDKIDSLDTKRAFDPPVSLCVSPDFRLLTICARLLQATLDKSQGYRVAEINIGELDSNPSSEVFWSTGGSASKSVHVSILAQEFQEYGQPRVWFSCLFDDTTMLAATLRRASQFAFHLRCKPSISPLKTQLWDDTEAWIIPKHATTLNIDTRNVYSASTNSANSIHTSQSIRASTSKPIYVRIFSFEATLGVVEKTNGWERIGPDSLRVRVGTSSISRSSHHDVSIYKIIQSDNALADLSAIETADLYSSKDGQQVIMTRPRNDSPPFRDIGSLMSEAGAKWASSEVILVQGPEDGSNDTGHDRVVELSIPTMRLLMQT